MADLTQEQFEQLPEFVKGDYEKSGEVYRPVAEGKLSALKGSMDQLDNKLKEIERTKAADIEAAREEALKTARTKGDVAAVEKRYQEEMAHLRKTVDEQLKERDEKYSKIASTLKTKEQALAINELASKLGIEGKSKDLFSKLMKTRIEVDPDTGKRTYLDENGGATSLDDAGFYAELDKDEAYHPWRKANVNRGGDANGSGHGGGAAKKFNEYTGAELKAIREKTPAEYERLRNEYKGTEA